MARELRDVVVVAGNRIPFARSGGTYARASNKDMLTATLDGLVARTGLAGETVGEVVGGAVLKHSHDWNLTRESVLGTALAAPTPAYDLQQACGTGLQAAVVVANKIAVGQIDSAISCGSDTTSDAPMGLSDGMRDTLMGVNRAKTPADKAKALLRLRPGHLTPNIPQAAEPRTGLSMGEHMAITARDWGITREAQDEFAFASHRNLAAAYERGFFDDLVTPFLGLTRDNAMRAESSVEKLASLKPVFGADRDDATMTAGNSTPLTDGASAVLLSSRDWARERHLTPMARFVDAETAAVDFVHGAEGLLMAPAYAAARLLRRNHLTLQDFDYYEIHEAFASTVLATLAAWESEEFCRTRLGLDAALGSIDRTRLNVNGSSLAAGHPFAATGGRLIATLAKLLHDKGSGRGLISVCAAGGQGVVAILEAC